MNEAREIYDRIMLDITAIYEIYRSTHPRTCMGKQAWAVRKDKLYHARTAVLDLYGLVSEDPKEIENETIKAYFERHKKLPQKGELS
jgi:hypothetical protein